jgi:hypothetical protein
MYLNFAVATVFLGLISMNAFGIEEDEEGKKRRHAAKLATVNQFEPVVDIHNSAVILEHPTVLASNAESIAKLNRLEVEGAARERTLRTWHAAHGRAYPERFAGD